MSKIALIITICLILISPTGAGTLLTGSTSVIAFETYNKKLENKQNEIAAQEKAEADAKAAEEAAYNKLHTYSSLKRYELEGYGFISVPETHFTLNDSKSTTELKEFTYTYSDISYIDIKFRTDLTEEDIDNLGTNVCNFDTEPEHEKITCGDIEAIRLEKLSSDDSYSKISWCIIKGKSAWIINGFVAPDVDIEPFKAAVETGIATEKVYYVSKTVFTTPKTGYYATLEIEDESNSDETETTEGSGVTTSGIVEELDRTVGGEIEGTVSTNKVSENWEDMRQVLDGDLIYVPCKMAVLLSYGYHILDNDETTVESTGKYVDYTLYKDNGTTLIVRAFNLTDSTIDIKDIDVSSIMIDRNEMGKYTPGSEYDSTNLPEFITTSGATWDISYDNLKKCIGNFVRKILSDGNYQLTLEEGAKTEVILTYIWENITSVKISYDLFYSK